MSIVDYMRNSGTEPLSATISHNSILKIEVIPNNRETKIKPKGMVY